MTTRDEAITAAARILVEAVIEMNSRTPREAAEAAYYRGHSLGSVEAIEALIIEQRAEAARLYAESELPAAA